jgi:hypothetical protein
MLPLKGKFTDIFDLPRDPVNLSPLPNKLSSLAAPE